MSEREQAKQIIDKLPDYKISTLLTFLRGMSFDDEMEDDAFCLKMYYNYLNDPDKGDFVPFEEVLKECGVELDELQDKH